MTPELGPEIATEFWPVLVGLISLVAQVSAVGHAILTKQDAKAASAWVGVIVLVPIVGWVVYLLFGINRIQRRAEVLRAGGHETGDLALPPAGVSALTTRSPEATRQLTQMSTMGRQISPVAYVEGNQVDIFDNGDQAFPAMCKAIEQAQHSIALSTYIFNNDRAGKQFIDALFDAHQRGVEVRVLIDGVGSHYSFPSAYSLLVKLGIPSARFLHSFMPWRMPYLNLRNHHKILVIDGKIGFTGSMNISEGNLLHPTNDHPIRDHHFKVTGPVLRHLMGTFAHEWHFTTDEVLTGPLWFPQLETSGNLMIRGVPAGPDMERNPIRWTLLAALSTARNKVQIVSPYFLPDTTLRDALSLCAMRGVEIDIILPHKNNLPYMQWAMTPQMPDLIKSGCRIWYSNGPFDHTKLMTVDGMWSFIGSANWDTRSLRLNFEFNLECYGEALAHDINQRIDDRLASATPVSLDQLKRRSTLERLRDASVALFAPYL